MKHTLIKCLSSIYRASGIKSSRSFVDLFADRIRVASGEQSISRFVQRLMEMVKSSPSEVDQKSISALIIEANRNKSEANALLVWLRENSALASILSQSSKDDQREVMDAVELSDLGSGNAAPRPAYGIKIEATLLSPLSHGSDSKAGNATLFRRMKVMSTTGGCLDLPYFAGNALRGVLRDIVADNFLSALGLTISRVTPPVSLWFFHVMYCGGALTDSGARDLRGVENLIGAGSTLKTQGQAELRSRIPGLSLLGSAISNRILSGRLEVGDLRPVCREWGTGSTSVADLISWVYLTRREDYEAYTDHSGMIANTEVLKPGAVLEGGIDLSKMITPLELSCLGDALESWQAKGRLGAQSARDLGLVQISLSGAPSGEHYREWLAQNSTEILTFLRTINAIQ